MNEEFTTNEEVMENGVVFNEVERVDGTLPAEVPEDDYDVEESEQKSSVAGTVATVALVGAIGIGAVVGMTKLYRKIREKIAKKHEPEQKQDGDSVIDVTADSAVYDTSEDQVEESSKTEEKVDILKNFDSTKKDEKTGK